jgi:hypothetical protein
MSVLDDPVWHALTGSLARFGAGSERARGFAADVAPFAAIIAARADVYDDLEGVIGNAPEVRLFRPAIALGNYIGIRRGGSMSRSGSSFVRD